VVTLISYCAAKCITECFESFCSYLACSCSYAGLANNNLTWVPTFELCDQEFK
jgi:hypothetical protein